MIHIDSIDGYKVNLGNPVPRILFWDIETAKMIIEMNTYSLKQYSNFLNPMDIKRDIWMVCVAWKWLGDSHISSTSVLNDPERFARDYADDYHVIATIHKLMDSADIVVAHNGDAFDWKIFTSRCIKHNLVPPKKPVMIDTLKVARREFKFSSNQLRYLAKFLDVSDKDNAPEWDLVAHGDREAIQYCEKYCRQDIRTLEGVYLKLRPYITNHPNCSVMLSGVHHETCPKCGSGNFKRNGYKYSQGGKYQAYQCGECYGFFQGKKNLKEIVNK